MEFRCDCCLTSVQSTESELTTLGDGMARAENAKGKTL